MPDRKLHVFLCHSSQDAPSGTLQTYRTRILQRLNAAPQEGDKDWIDPYPDEEKFYQCSMLK